MRRWTGAGRGVPPAPGDGSLRAGRPAGNPRIDQRTELLLRPWRRRPPRTWIPRPSDQGVGAHVMADLRQVTVAVALEVLQLLADLAQRLALPGHRGGGQRPVRVAGNRPHRVAQGHRVRLAVAAVARHAWQAVIVGTTGHFGHVRMQVIALRGGALHRMAVEAAWMLQHFARLFEQRDRALALVLDAIEFGDVL